MTKDSLKRKYIIHVVLVVISLVLLIITKGDIVFILLFIALILFLLVDMIFDILGYSDSNKSIPVVKRFFGYIIGTIFFMVILIVLQRAINLLLK